MKFLETIRFENGQYHLLDLHQFRLERTFATFFPESIAHQLIKILPELKESGKLKVRVEYNSEDFEITIEPYKTRKVNSIKLVESSFDYSFKFSDRTAINQLVEESNADDIILIKDGMITDSSYANLAFFDGDKWWTPEKPLLKGVRRASLLASGKIQERDIRVSDLKGFQKLGLINAILDLGELEFKISSLTK